MDPQSPNRHEATTKTYSYDQTFIDEPLESIEARVVRERELEITDLEWLFGSQANSPRSVGISPAYSKSGTLPALACALGNRVLVINFLSSKPYEDGITIGPRPRNIERRNKLEQELLSHPDCTLYAFDLAPIALSLRLHLHLHISNAIDIQSALPVPTRSPVDSVQVVQTQGPYCTGAEGLACGYIGQYDLGTAQDLFYKAPKVDMKKFSADVSLVLTYRNVIRHAAARQYEAYFRDPRNPNAFNRKTQQVVAESQRYSNRITPGTSTVKVTLAHGSSTTFTVTGDAGRIRGRSAPIETEHNMEGKVVTSITTIGRDLPTAAESDRSDSLLRILQGSLSLLDNHWMKAIWRPSDSVDWPESFTSSTLHPHRNC
ncbi:hypothetical protein EI94DRAFT_1806535 [Lactarius quietus]|nr:hypothetical protein EI94DRAFT_1806535 [Lactarius quietus]